jgi:hypothetical protein
MTMVGYGGAAAGLRHAVYRWGATQALWIPPMQTRILPYPQKVNTYTAIPTKGQAIPRQLCVRNPIAIITVLRSYNI